MVALLVLYLIRPEDGSFPPVPGQGFSEGDGAGEVFRGFGSQKKIAPPGIYPGGQGRGRTADLPIFRPSPSRIDP